MVILCILEKNPDFHILRTQKRLPFNSTNFFNMNTFQNIEIASGLFDQMIVLRDNQDVAGLVEFVSNQTEITASGMAELLDHYEEMLLFDHMIALRDNGDVEGLVEFVCDQTETMAGLLTERLDRYEEETKC